MATTAALDAVMNEILNVNDLAKKTDCDAKRSDIEGKYFTITDYNKFINEILDAKIKNLKGTK